MKTNRNTIPFNPNIKAITDSSNVDDVHLDITGALFPSIKCALHMAVADAIVPLLKADYRPPKRNN
ncbi:MAG: hypothetical protein GY757_09825 [bacterium]|nr:hypothetical protein [bacterium]